MNTNPDPIIAPHTIEWLACLQSYNSLRAPSIGAWTLSFQNEDTCIYSLDSQSIIAFRGTQTSADIINDIQLSQSYSNFNKIAPAVVLVTEYIKETNHACMLTGHSLGGALARQVCRELGIKCVTFNCAAPPSSVVPRGVGEVHYHVVFDLISAWQGGAVRIDKGFRPNMSGLVYWLRKIPFVGKYAGALFKSYSLKQMVEAHKLSNFGNGKRGQVVDEKFEDDLWKGWYKRVPTQIKLYFLAFTSVSVLPPVPLA